MLACEICSRTSDREREIENLREDREAILTIDARESKEECCDASIVAGPSPSRSDENRLNFAVSTALVYTIPGRYIGPTRQPPEETTYINRTAKFWF